MWTTRALLYISQDKSVCYILLVIILSLLFFLCDPGLNMKDFLPIYSLKCAMVRKGLLWHNLFLFLPLMLYCMQYVTGSLHCTGFQKTRAPPLASWITSGFNGLAGTPLGKVK